MPARTESAQHGSARTPSALESRASIEDPHLLAARLRRDASGRVGLALESSTAPSVEAVLARGPLRRKDAVRIVHGVASALEALGRAGLVGRELTPNRILLDRSRGAILADFGISPGGRPARPRARDPHCAYRSPEERRGGGLSTRSNVYSLGAIFLTCLTGAKAPERLPHDLRVRLPAPLESVIAKATALDPQHRFENAAELTRAAVAAVRETDAPAARPAPPKASEPVAPQTAKATRAVTPKPPKIRAPRSPRSARTSRLKNAARGKVARVHEGARVKRGQLSSLTRMRPVVPAGVLVAKQSLKRRAAVGSAVSAGALRHIGAPPRRLVVAASVLATAAAGIAVVGAGDHHQQHDGPQRPSRISAGPLSVRPPSGWERAPRTIDDGMPFSIELSAAPSGGGGPRMVTGLTSDPVAAERVLGGMQAGGMRRARVRLGRREAWHYAGLRPGPGLTGIAYVAYTAGPSLVVLCQAPVSEVHALRACSRAVPTVKLQGERPVSLAVEARRRLVAARTALRNLDQERLAARQRLAEAVVAEDQRDAARIIQVEYRAAVRGVEQSGVRGPHTAALVGALRDAGDAYGDLAGAISEGDQLGYDEARAAILDAEAAVWNETNR